MSPNNPSMYLRIFLAVGLAFSSVSFIGATVVSAQYWVQAKQNHCVANQVLPDKDCTPWAILTTDITKICRSGYTKTVRNVSTSLKKRVFAQYWIPYSLHSGYEVDHLISLELWGSNDISNLFPESYGIENGAKEKDKFENYLHKQVCDGLMTIQEAQSEISTDWLFYSQLRLKQKTQEIKTPQLTPGITSLEVKIPVQTIPEVTQSTQTILPSVVPVVETPSIINTSDPEVKLSNSGICHEKGSTYYNQTKNFTSYSSLQDCLNAGGRMPKR